MTEHLRLIEQKLKHLQRMADYLEWSRKQVSRIIPIHNWEALTPDQHESLAAFRIRFSEFQEHLGKTMRSIAFEEEAPTEPFGAVLAFMEKIQIIDSTEHWKLIRELRNAINHEYEEKPDRLAQLFEKMLSETSTLAECHQRLVAFCRKAYNLGPEH